MREIVVAEIKTLGSTFNFWAALTEIKNSRSVSGVDVVLPLCFAKIT
jgi:hypothetical protein